MENVRLSPNFVLSELVHSDTADRLGIDNWPTEDYVVENLKTVTQNILQPLREYTGIPFAPTSGYRCLELNRALKSKDTSQHVQGQAVDIKVPGFSTFDIALWIQENLEFDQLILELYKPGEPFSGWVHCSYADPDSNRNQVLTYAKGQGFLEGLVQ